MTMTADTKTVKWEGYSCEVLAYEEREDGDTDVLVGVWVTGSYHELECLGSQLEAE